MQKKLLITLLTIILIIILTLTLHVSIVNASPVIFNMDTLPENQGWRLYKSARGNVTLSVSNGILTIERAGFGEFAYYAPADWYDTVNNTKGWIVEFRMKIDPTSRARSLRVDIGDNYLGIPMVFLEDGINFEASNYLMNVTDTFHVYRIIGQGNMLRVIIDERLISTTPSFDEISGPLRALTIETPGYNFSKSYWDYISYDTNPNITLTSPTLTVVDGTSSYYISDLSNVTVDDSLTLIPNGIYAGWCVDKSVTMIRNEVHNVALYSTIDSTLPDNIEQYNWNAVNYILNHKQGSMQEIQDAIWYFVPDFVTPSSNETNTWNMINAAKANSNYVPSKGDLMAIIVYAGHDSGTSTSGNGVQNTILEYRIP